MARKTTAIVALEPEVRAELKRRYVDAGYRSYSDYLKAEILDGEAG